MKLPFNLRTYDDPYILLEYNPKQRRFHHNTVYDGQFDSRPYTFGWEPIALTLESKANLFGNAIAAVLHKRMEEGKEPLSTITIKKGWKIFCFVYNYLARYSIPDHMRHEAEELFCAEMAMARMGNGHFTDLMTEDTPWAWEYDPLSYEDSNY